MRRSFVSTLVALATAIALLVTLAGSAAADGARAAARERCAVIYSDEAGVFWSVTPGGAKYRLSWPRPTVDSAGWSRDGRRGAAVYTNGLSGKSRLVIVDRANDVVASVRLPDRSSRPHWSPDGTRIGFTGETIDAPSVWVVGAGGKGLHRLTHGTGWSRLASWSPDGSRLLIVRSSNPNALGGSLWTIAASGGNLRRVRVNLPDVGNADLSPDGRTIVLTTSRDGIFSVGIDGRHWHRLTRVVGDDFPEWSPDGSRIAFERDGGDPPTDVWVMQPDGTHQFPVTKSDTNDHSDLGKSLEGWRCP